MKQTLTNTCCWLLLLLPGVTGLRSQELHVQFMASAGIGFTDPVVAAKAGDHFVVLDAPTEDGTPAFIFTPAFTLLKKIMLPRNAYNGLYGPAGRQVFFTWQERIADSTVFRMALVDDTGNIQQMRRTLPANQSLGGYRWIIADKAGNFLLFYSLFTDAAKHLVLNGTVFNMQLQLLKTFRTSVDYDAALERFSAPIIDTKGNVHLLVYDKLTNYRLSGHVRMNTLALGDQAITTESFEFDKTKFYDVLFFDNPVKQQVVLTGFYYNGSTRIKQGLALIQFPYTQNQTMTDKFMPLSQEQRNQLQDGMKSVRRKNDVMDFVKLRDIIEEDGEVFASTWLLDIPNKEFLKDNEQEEMRNTEVSRWLSPEKQGNYTPRPVNSPGTMYADRFATSIVGVSAMPEVSSSQPGGNRFLNIRPNPQRRMVDLLGPAGSTQHTGPAPPLIQLHKLPSKLAYFHVNTSGDTAWQQVVPGDFPVATASYQPMLWNYPLAGPNSVFFIAPPRLEGKKKKAAQFVGLQEQKITTTALADQWPDNIYISRPLKLASQKYLAAYIDEANDKRGLVLLEIR
jgi:hypothetical protein